MASLLPTVMLRHVMRMRQASAKHRLAVLAVAAVAAFAGLAVDPAGTSAAEARTCSPGYTHAVLTWGQKCLRAGQFCKVSADRQYHRYRFHCHTGGRLTRTATPSNPRASGCQPGYSPCLPRVADLNCADIPTSKKPVRVTGSDPYRLDGDGDGIACEP
jgi:Excalibur calcium-binding domain